MHKLIKLNVIKIVDSEIKRDKLVKNGYVELVEEKEKEQENEIENNNNIDLDSLDFMTLKKMLSGKGINTYKLKKEDCIEILKKMIKE